MTRAHAGLRGGTRRIAAGKECSGAMLVSAWRRSAAPTLIPPPTALAHQLQNSRNVAASVLWSLGRK